MHLCILEMLKLKRFLSFGNNIIPNKFANIRKTKDKMEDEGEVMGKEGGDKEDKKGIGGR